MGATGVMGVLGGGASVGVSVPDEVVGRGVELGEPNN